MKIALYIEDGLEQIVLTPQNVTEKNVLAKLHDGAREMSIHRGEFYHCQGGWLRQGGSESSTIIALRPVTLPVRGKDEPELPTGASFGEH